MNSVFIHIPKTAGGYVVNRLGLRHLHFPRRIKDGFNQEGMVYFGHQNYARLVKRGIVNKEFDKSAFKFTFCRNPFDRVVSHYFWTRKMHPDILKHDISFLDFTRMFGEPQRPNRISRRIGGGDWFRPQKVSVENISLDFIGKYESLDNDLNKLAKIFNIELKPSGIIRKTRHDHYQKYYNDESADNVRRYYKDDFEFFKYDDNLLYGQ